MPIPVILPLLLIALAFFLLPFVGSGRFFSMPVNSDWLMGNEARRTRLVYQAAIVLITAVCVVAGAFSKLYPHLSFASLLLELIGIMSAWSWGWSRTLPFRLHDSVVRSAVLRPSSAARATHLWSLAALIPLFATALVLLSKYRSIPSSFAINFSASGVPGHIVLRSWLSVFGPLAVGGVVIVLLSELLTAIQRRGAGVADRGKYFALTGRIVAAASWIVGAECAASALPPIMHHAGTYTAYMGAFSGAAALGLLLITTGFLIKDRTVLVAAQGTTDAAHWRVGLFYFNRDDMALFVPKRLGLGWTLNMAYPGAWLLLGFTLLIALVGLALKHL